MGEEEYRFVVSSPSFDNENVSSLVQYPSSNHSRMNVPDFFNAVSILRSAPKM